MKNCPNCGVAIDDNAKTCSLCGFEFEQIHEHKIPDQNYNGGFQPPPMQNPPPMNYGYPQSNTPAKSKATPVPIAVIAILAVALVGIGILLFLHNSQKSGGNQPEGAASPASSDASAPTTEVVTDTAEPETEASEEKTESSADDIMSVYKTVLSEKTGSGTIADYVLYDMDHDGSPEMWVNYGSNDSDMKMAVYTYKDKSAKVLSDNMETGHVKFGYDFIADQIVIIKGSDSEKEMMWYDIDDSGALRFLISSGKLDYTKGVDYMLQYNVENLETGYISSSSSGSDHLERKLSGTFTNPDKDAPAYQKPTKAAAKPTASIKVEPQSINGNGTCLLMTVSGDYSYYTFEIYADCEGTKNTLRKSGTSYDRSYQYDDGSTVSNFVFYVTPYNADGIAGERESLNYNGPMSLPPNISSVTACTKYGQIYAPDGKINGYASSYIVDGGAMSKIRTDLTNNWHVTAVNYFTKNGTTWYELYDTDDGDYYGWVDEGHITFY